MFFSKQEADNPGTGNRLREDSGKGCTPNTHFEYKDKDGVQNDIAYCTDQNG